MMTMNDVDEKEFSSIAILQPVNPQPQVIRDK